MNILVAPDFGGAYRWSEQWKQLEFCPMFENGLISENEWSCVEEELIGDEMVHFRGKDMTFSEVYRQVEDILKPKEVKMLVTITANGKDTMIFKWEMTKEQLLQLNEFANKLVED